MFENNLLCECLCAENPKTEKQDTFVEKLVTQVIKNLQVRISNIHIRYEDSVSTQFGRWTFISWFMISFFGQHAICIYLFIFSHRSPIRIHLSHSECLYKTSVFRYMLLQEKKIISLLLQVKNGSVYKKKKVLKHCSICNKRWHVVNEIDYWLIRDNLIKWILYIYTRAKWWRWPVCSWWKFMLIMSGCFPFADSRRKLETLPVGWESQAVFQGKPIRRRALQYNASTLQGFHVLLYVAHS